jgi:hypothetical protein
MLRQRRQARTPDGSAKLTQAAYWQAIQGYLRPGDVLFVDNGTSYALFGLKLPPNCTFIGSVNWGSIGYSVGALLGALTAAPDRRHLLFVGDDGSFQVTAQELSTILRHEHKPVIFLINNGGYTIERGYLGKAEPYNDIANWAYADLPKVFRPDTSARSFVVKTSRDLQNALGAPPMRCVINNFGRRSTPRTMPGSLLEWKPRLMATSLSLIFACLSVFGKSLVGLRNEQQCPLGLGIGHLMCRGDCFYGERSPALSIIALCRHAWMR